MEGVLVRGIVWRDAQKKTTPIIVDLILDL